MKFILGQKSGMSQIFDNQGNVIPVTLVVAGPLTVTQIKTKEKDGYEAVQVGFVSRKSENKAGKNKSFRYLREFRFDKNKSKSSANQDLPMEGDIIDTSLFQEGDVVKIRGISKGKGFQGVVKRHGFHGGPRTHGQKHSEREPGSIGATAPQRVFKGIKMAGRMGGKMVQVKNLKVVKIDKNAMWVLGAVPGRKGTLLEIRAND